MPSVTDHVHRRAGGGGGVDNRIGDRITRSPRASGGHNVTREPRFKSDSPKHFSSAAENYQLQITTQ